MQEPEEGASKGLSPEMRAHLTQAAWWEWVFGPFPDKAEIVLRRLGAIAPEEPEQEVI